MTSIAEHLTAEQVKAARALLAWSQQELAGAARVATSTVADFERGARTPTENNALAIRKALENEGLQFVAAGVVSKAMMPSTPTAPRAGALVRWVNATHLSQWGESRNGQSGMPELLSRLVYATVGPTAQIRFPADESVQYPGWDGVCIVANGVGYVPAGPSVWEIGAQRSGVRSKANCDFEKRSKNPLGHNCSDATFVFVTPQRFVGKDDWAAEKKALGLWRDVVAIDADDLVHWLETCPAVAQWLSVRIGRRPAGLRNLEEAWFEWASTTEIPLSSDIVLTGRDAEQAAVLRWLRGPPAHLSIQAEAPDEAIAFLHASISPLPKPYRLTYYSHCVVADAPETARELVGLGTPLVIVMTEPEAGLAQRLVADGHHVFGAYGPNTTAFNATRLPRPWRFDLQQALTAAGVSEEEAHRLAHASGRSITVLRRLMPAAPQHRNAWATQASPELIAAMFAGAWSDSAPRDRQILSDLARRPYEEVTSRLAPLAGLGGPIIRAGEIWKVVSLQDLWTQIGGQVTDDQVHRFEAAFQSVLGVLNPRYDRRPKSKYYEADGEFGEECSGALRSGLTEAAIALAVYPERAELVPLVGERVGALIRKLLDHASPALWWSLSKDFHNLAEAAPGAFLDALEHGLEGDNPSVKSLFRSDEGVMHPTEYLSDLLWALEMLARSPDYLTRAALVLAQLDAIDPGGSWGNRPGASLRRIFLSWSPQTYATLKQRLKVLDRIINSLPATGWKLLVNLAPRDHDTTVPSSQAKWRDFSTDRPEVITWQAVATATRAIGARLLDNVGGDVDRWCDLIDYWGNFEHEWRTVAAEKMEAFAATITDSSVAEKLRDELRIFIRKNRNFSDKEWALPEEELAPLDRVIDCLQPTSVEDRVRWLFRPGAHPMSPTVHWEAAQEELETEQIKAVEALLAECTPEQIFAFAQTVTMHHALGIAIAKTSALAEQKFDLMQRGLVAEDAASVDVGTAILFSLRNQAGEGGEALINQLWARAIEEEWGEVAEVRLTLLLPASAATAAAVAARSPELEKAYWKALSVHSLPNEIDPNFVVDHLIAVDRARAAVTWLGSIIAREPSGAVLIKALRAAAEADEPLKGNEATMFSYYVGQIFKRLDVDNSVDEREIVSLEWIYFQALRHSDRPARTLHSALARDPAFFAHLLKLVFLPAKDGGVEEPQPEDQERAENMFRQAYDVLHDWAHVPGADQAGIIDGLALEAWVKEARKLLNASGRGEIGDSKIGEILSASRREPDQAWPPVPVREVIEMVRSRALESGFEVGVYNRRGVTVRMPHDGGGQERALAASYRRDAEALRFDWPRTAACLDRIAATYEVDASREDLRAEQKDWL